MPKYLSGRAKLVPQAALSDDRYRYLALDQAEPNPSNPSTLGIADGDNSPAIPSGTRYQLVTIHGDTTGNRYWVPVGGGIIPGSISVYEEGSLVGTANSITQLDFLGNVVTASAPTLNPRATLTFRPPGDDSNVLFKESNDFATSSNLLFNSSAGILTSSRLNIGLGGTIITAHANTGIASVGIGTTIPTQQLHVRGNLRLTGTLYDGDNFEGSTGDLIVKASDGSLEWKAPENVQSGAGGTISEIQYHDDTGLVDGAPNFVWIESTQRIGIGSTQPRTLLDVVGIASFSNVEVSGVSTTYGLLDINGGGQATTFKVEDLTEDRVVIVGSQGELEDSSDLTFSGNVLTVTNTNVTGVTTLGTVRIESNTIDTNSGNLILDSSAGIVQSQDIFFINDSTDSSDPDSGALQVNGGVGINKNVNVGGGLSITGPVVGVAVTLSAAGGITTVGGDLYIAGDLYVKDDIMLDEGKFQSLIVNPGVSTFKGDVQFHGNTGVTSAYWDSSEDSLKFVDDAKAVFGTGGDLQVYYTDGDGSNEGSVFKHTGPHDMRFQVPSGAHDIVFETTSGANLAVYNADGAVELHYRGSSGAGRKLQTTASGVTLDGGLLVSAGVGTFADDAKFTGSTSDLLWDKSANALEFDDETRAKFGDNGDLQISHTIDLSGDVDFNGDSILDGGDWCSYIQEKGTGPLIFKTDGGPGSGAYQFYDTAWRPILKLFSGTNARAALYHSATERLITTSAGIEITGKVDTDELNVSGISTFLGEFHDKDGNKGSDGDFLTATSGGLAEWRNETALTIENARKVGIGSTTLTRVYYPSFVRDVHLPSDRGNEHLYVDVGLTYSYNATNKTGAVGIGTSGPTEALDVVGTTTTRQLFVSGISTFVGLTTVTSLDALHTKQFNVLGISTFGSTIDANGDLDVDGHTELDNVKVSGITTLGGTLSVAGVSTFSSSIDANGDLDVDGQTELDDVNISGITTLGGTLRVAGVSTFVGIASFLSGIKDKDGDLGLNLQLLQSTGSQVVWADPDSVVIGEAKKVQTQQNTTDAPFYLTFVDSNNPSTDTYESVYTGAGITFNASNSSLALNGRLFLKGTSGINDGDIVSNGGSDGNFSINNIGNGYLQVNVNNSSSNAVGIVSFTSEGGVSDADKKTWFESNIYPTATDTYDLGANEQERWDTIFGRRGLFNTVSVSGITTTNHFEVIGVSTFIGITSFIGISSFTSNVSINSGLVDKDGDLGTNLQILQSTGSQVVWADPDAVTIGQADKVQTQSISSNGNYYITFVDSNNPSTGTYESVYTGAGITFCPDSNSLGISGNVYVGGVLTYEDVTNVDSIGIVTAGKGLRVTEGGVVVQAGVSTFSSHLLPLINEGANIGESASLRWNQVYAKDFFGTFNGGIAPSGDIDIEEWIRHIGDLDTKFGFPIDDTYAVHTAGVERLRISSDGKVGIGSTAPTQVLDVDGNGQFAGHVLPSVTDTYDLGSSTLRWRNVYAENLGIGTDISETIFTKSGNFNGTDQVIDDDAVASSADLLEYTIFFELNSDTSKIQSGKANIMCNGTSSYISEYGIMYNNTRIANLSTDVDGGNIRLLGTSTEQVNYKLVRRTLS